MEASIIVFLWIVGALCLFIIAFLTYDLIVRAQDRKAQRQTANNAPAEPQSEAPRTTSKPEPAPASSPAEAPKPTPDPNPASAPSRKKPNKKTERWTDRHKHRRKK